MKNLSIKLIAVLVGITLIGGCYTHAPENMQLHQNVTLTKFIGTYSNFGYPSYYENEPTLLSAAIFKNIKWEQHKKISRIKASLKEDVIHIDGISADNRVLTQATYKYLDDFEIIDNEITIYENSVMFNEGPGDLFVGPRKRTLKLTLDTEGNIITVDKTYFAGAAAMVMPIAGRVRSYIRFDRIE